MPDILHGSCLCREVRVPERQHFANAFCRVRGSSLPRIRETYFVAPAGTLDAQPGALQQRHTFVGSKAPWFEIGDALPRLEAGVPR